MAPNEAGLGEGERRERGARRARFGIKSGLFAFGLVTGLYAGGNFIGSGFDFSAPWSPVAAAVIALVYIAAMGIGSLLMSRHVDELERDRGYKAVAAAGAAYVLVYPVWFALWKGGFAVEPVHWLLFVLFWLSLALASLWYRFVRSEDMIRKLIAVAVIALIAAPLVSLHQLGAIGPGASVSLFSEDGGLVFILEVRGLAPLEPLLAAVTL